MSHILYRLLTTLDAQRLRYRLDRHRPDSVTLTIMVTDERSEVDVFEDGAIAFSRFRGDQANAKTVT